MLISSKFHQTKTVMRNGTSIMGIFGQNISGRGVSETGVTGASHFLYPQTSHSNREHNYLTPLGRSDHWDLCKTRQMSFPLVISHSLYGLYMIIYYRCSPLIDENDDLHRFTIATSILYNQ